MECLHLLQHGVWKCMCFAKSWKILFFKTKHKTLLVMFYRHNKTIWYQFCNFKHFLKAQNSEDSLASSCAVLLVCHVTQYETGLLLEPRGVTSTKIVRGCACQTSKIWLSLHQFLPNFPPISIPSSQEKHPISTKLGAFYNDLPKKNDHIPFTIFHVDHRVLHWCIGYLRGHNWMLLAHRP